MYECVERRYIRQKMCFRDVNYKLQFQFRYFILRTLLLPTYNTKLYTRVRLTKII